MIDGEADDGETNSLQVIGIAGLEAIKDGNNFMMLTAEGAHRKVEASGWGIGFYTTGGLISSNGQESGIMGGGTGYSSNETGPEDRPWIQGYVGCREMQFLIDQIKAFEAPKVSKSPAKKTTVKKTTVKKVVEEKPQTGNHRS